MTTVGGGDPLPPFGPHPCGDEGAALRPACAPLSGGRWWFDIEVNDEKGKCGEGSHLRIMVAPKGIQEKAEQKKD